jgi:filamentous hemagglutinin family protein
MKLAFSILLGITGLLLFGQAGLAQIVGQDTTTVTPGGTQFDITGGASAGTNLFHSFSQFGLSASQTANFEITNPAIQNVFSRVTGGSPSVINGTILSNGGNAPNFYFMNPAGIVFGPNFTLSIPAAFTATTANGIAFGNNWFNATSPNNYTNLLGNPTAFGFTMAQPAAIINNATSLTNSPPLTLIAGTVVSPGPLKVDLNRGPLTIAAVPGRSLVRITSTDSLLGLEIRPFQAAETQPNDVVAAIPSLAELVTGPAPGGGTVSDATGVGVNPDGTLTLTGAGMSIQPGDVQTAALQGSGVLIGAPVGNVMVSTIYSGDLGIDITAGKFFRATGTFGSEDTGLAFRESLPIPGNDLLAFLKLKTGLSDADIISKYPSTDFNANPYVISQTAASIFVKRGLSLGNGDIVIRYGGGTQLKWQGGGTATLTGGNAPFALGGKVTLNSPDLADRYRFINPAASFIDLAKSTPGGLAGSPESENPVFNLQRNQTTAIVPIPANFSGTVGSIIQNVRQNGTLQITFGNQVFGQLPTNPVTPTNPANPTSPSSSTTAVAASLNSVVANVQQGGARSPANAQCQPTSIKIAGGTATANASRSATASTGCTSADDDAAILKILE